LIQEKFVIHFIIQTIFFSVGDTAALGPRKFCNQYNPHAPEFSYINPVPVIGLPNTRDRHYDAGPGQISASTYPSDEIPMYKFMLTKEEEEKEEEKKKNNDNEKNT